MITATPGLNSSPSHRPRRRRPRRPSGIRRSSMPTDSSPAAMWTWVIACPMTPTGRSRRRAKGPGATAVDKTVHAVATGRPSGPRHRRSLSADRCRCFRTGAGTATTWASNLGHRRRPHRRGCPLRIPHRPVPPQPARPLAENPGPGAGLWFDLGPHLADQALQLFGLPDAVTADLASLRAGSRTDDWAHVLLDYPRRRVVLHASMLAAGTSPVRRARHCRHSGQARQRHSGGSTQGRCLTRCAGLGRGSRRDAPLRCRRSPAPPPDAGRRPTAVLPRTGPGDHRVRPQSHTPQEILAVMAVVDAAREAARTGHCAELALSQDERAHWDQRPR